KMNMFNDLRYQSDVILENQNILKLLGNFDKEEGSPIEEPVYPVVDADESQLMAIHAASNGESFVLQGPPGTGKSQTITNMIASLIGNGKKVLFVSEKQAALNVVYENLRRAGLDSFAIELHSHKANKKEFIDELYKTAILPRYEIKSSAEDFARKYSHLSTLLEEYRTKLHQKIDRLGISLYEIYSAFLKVEQTDILYKIENIEAYSLEDLQEIKQSLDQYSTLSTTLGYDYKKGPFYGFISSNTSYIRYEAKQDFEQIYTFYKELSKIQDSLTKALPFEIRSFKHVVDAMPYLDKITQLNYFMPEYFVEEERMQLCGRIDKYKQLTEYFRKSNLKKFIDLKIIQINDIENLVKLFEVQSKKVFKYILPSYYRVKKELSSYSK
ncbi:MAG: AAA family ATPase, partial [Anaeroplasmataceae bacterium]|nr:AAA family ATPase [Anaeroplasmataceae bacterium]